MAEPLHFNVSFFIFSPRTSNLKEIIFQLVNLHGITAVFDISLGSG